MKKIVRLVISLCIINTACVIGMELQPYKPDSSQNLQRRSAPSATTESVDQLWNEISTYSFSMSKCFSSVLGITALASLESFDTANCNKAVCLDPKMIYSMLALMTASTIISAHEMYYRKPFFTSSKKSALLSATNYTAAALSWAYLSLDDCPDNLPGNCTELRKGLCYLNALATVGVIITYKLTNKR